MIASLLKWLPAKPPVNHGRELSKQGHTKRRKKVHDMVDKMRAEMGKEPIDWANL